MLQWTFAATTERITLDGPLYQLQGFALTLTLADGDTRHRTIFVASPGEPVGLISVEGEVYTRK